MPATSKSQQRLMGMVRAHQKGELDNPSPKIKRMAQQMSTTDVRDFAKTKHDSLPEKAAMTPPLPAGTGPAIGKAFGGFLNKLKQNPTSFLAGGAAATGGAALGAHLANGGPSPASAAPQPAGSTAANLQSQVTQAAPPSPGMQGPTPSGDSLGGPTPPPAPPSPPTPAGPPSPAAASAPQQPGMLSQAGSWIRNNPGQAALYGGGGLLAALALHNLLRQDDSEDERYKYSFDKQAMIRVLRRRVKTAKEQNLSAMVLEMLDAMPRTKTASARRLSAELAAKRTVYDAVKTAYPHLDVPTRYKLAAALSRAAYNRKVAMMTEGASGSSMGGFGGGTGPQNVQTTGPMSTSVPLSAAAGKMNDMLG